MITYATVSKNGSFMSRRCQVTGKIPVTGNRYAIRGIAKKKKGIGLKITGIKRRRFKPNLVKKRFWFSDENRFITLRTSTNGMRTIDKLGLSAVVRRMRKAGEKI
jgi:large subunit ribosomal protein L28